MTRPIDNTTRENHAETADNLLRLIAEFKITLNAGEKIGTVQAQNAVFVLESARTDLWRCKTAIVHWRTDLMPAPELEDHRKLIDWIGLLHIDLSLMLDKLDVQMEPMTLERMERGEQLVNDLPKCRKSLVSYR